MFLSFFLLAGSVPSSAQNSKNWLRAAERAAQPKTLSSKAKKSAWEVLSSIEEFPLLPSVQRHYNRRQKNPPISRFQPDEDTQDLWIKIKRKHKSAYFVSKAKLIEKIVNRHHNMNAALIDLRKIQKTYGPQDFFHLFAVAYYRQEMELLSPSFYDFLKRISRLHNKELEERTVSRMQFLFQTKNQFMKNLLQTAPPSGSWRLHWIATPGPFQPSTFDPNRLVLEYERTLRAERRNVTLGHISVGTSIKINGQRHFILDYNQDLKYLANIYRKLLYQDPNGQPLRVFADIQNRMMIIYNQTGDRWIRLSSHEFSNPSNLHIHINQLHPVYLNIGNQTVRDQMIYTLTVPLASRPEMTPEQLEKAFFTEPLKAFSKDSKVSVVYQLLY